jgi:DHA2 family multidrug resistance protein
MIAFGYAVLGVSMLHYASFNLYTDYKHEALARALQGLGIAPLFVPVSQLAYSFLPKSKNNKASSLTNLFRNQGGSFGIAFVTTMLERRTQYHQAILAAHANSGNLALRSTLSALTARFERGGFSPADASVRALARAYQLTQRQAAILGFLDCFHLLAFVALLGVPLVLLTRKFSSSGPGSAH